MSAEEVIEHIDRLGSTPFKLDHIEVELDEGVGIGFSALHKIRAQACEQLEEALLAQYHERVLEKAPSRVFAPRIRKGSCKVAVLATNPACARAAKRAGADLIYVPVHNYRRGEAIIAGQLSQTAEQAGYPKGAFRYFLWLLMMAIAKRAMALTFGSVCRKTSPFSCRISGRSFMHANWEHKLRSGHTCRSRIASICSLLTIWV